VIRIMVTLKLTFFGDVILNGSERNLLLPLQGKNLQKVVSMYQTMWCQIRENSNVYIHCHEYLRT